ncbi:MAG: Hsp20/alpha crystallin family protein [Leptonema sp. (in: bacteria)]
MKWLPSKWKKQEIEENTKDKFMTPADYFTNFQRKIDEIFEEFFRDFGFPSSREWSNFYPRIDVKDNKDKIIVEADLPGISEKELEVSVTKDSIVLEGEKKHEFEESKENYYRKERSYGSFKRVIPLPVEIDDTKVEAKFKNGVLTIILPKSEKALENIKKIPIKVD